MPCPTTLLRVLGPRLSLWQELSGDYLHSLHPHYPHSRGAQHWPSLRWAGKPCQAPPQLPGHTPTPGEGWGLPREEAGMAVSAPHQLRPQAQNSFLSLHPPCPKSHLPVSVWSPTLVVQTTDKPSHAKWEFNCKQFLWIMGPSVPPYATGKKKSPFKKNVSPCPIPETDSKRNSGQGFSGWSPAWSWDPSWGLPSVWAWQSQGAE